MPITRVQSKAQAVADNTASDGETSLTLAFDSAPTEGNLLIAIAHARGMANGLPWQTPTNWNLAVKNGTQSPDPGHGAAIFYRIAGASEPSSVTIETSGAIADDAEGIMVLAEYNSTDGWLSPVLQGANFETSQQTDVTTVGTGDVTISDVPALAVGAICIRVTNGQPTNQAIGGGTVSIVDTVAATGDQPQNVFWFEGFEGETQTFEATGTWTTAYRALGVIAAFAANPPAPSGNPLPLLNHYYGG